MELEADSKLYHSPPVLKAISFHLSRVHWIQEKHIFFFVFVSIGVRSSLDRSRIAAA